MAAALNTLAVSVGAGIRQDSAVLDFRSLVDRALSSLW